MQVKLITLEKADCTIGTLYINSVKFCETMEPPWLDNEPFKSCIPSGKYTLVKHQSPKYGYKYHIVGETVSINGETKRTHCLFHAGNYVINTKGCAMLGHKTIIAKHRELMITNSVDTVRAFESKLDVAYRMQELIELEVLRY